MERPEKNRGDRPNNIRWHYIAGSVVLPALFYALFRLTTAVLWWFIDDVLQITCEPLDPQWNLLFCFGFVGFFLPLIYLSLSLIARKCIPLNMPKLVLFMGTVFLCAILAECVVDSLFVILIERPAWEYHIWPVHHGYTSGVGMFMWPLYGFYVYLLHFLLKEVELLAPLNNDIVKALILGADAMFLEILANFFALIFFHTFHFYYLRNDLYHFTTAEIFISYVLCGFVGFKILALLDRRERYRLPIGLVCFAAGILLILFIL
ncbi:hypothetical protein ACFLU6_03095 [Acidobacteriota bacterium]